MSEKNEKSVDLSDFMDELEEKAREKMQPGDYTGADSLVYCGKCHTPKKMRVTTGFLAGRIIPCLCHCEKEKRDREDAEEKVREKEKRVAELKGRGFLSRSMREWTFENDNGQNPQMQLARRYVQEWEKMKEKNIGLLIWGDVGCGKTYLAAAIANALMEDEIPVRMTNFNAIMNDLSGSFEGRNEYLDRLSGCPLLIIDDFGMERETDYGLELIYSVIDGRYRSRKPMIVTTNLTLTELRGATDTAHRRIYDRVLEMCVPVFCKGESRRRKTAEEKFRELKSILEEGDK